MVTLWISSCDDLEMRFRNIGAVASWQVNDGTEINECVLLMLLRKDSEVAKMLSHGLAERIVLMSSDWEESSETTVALVVGGSWSSIVLRVLEEVNSAALNRGLWIHGRPIRGEGIHRRLAARATSLGIFGMLPICLVDISDRTGQERKSRLVYTIRN